MGHEVSGVVAEVGQGVDRRVAGRARRLRDVLLDLRRLRVVPRRADEPLPGAALDRLVRRRRASRRRSSCPRGTCTAFRTELDEHAAALCEPLACVCHCLCDPPRSPPATTCSSPGRGPSGCSPPRSRARSAADVLVTGLARGRGAAGGGEGARVRDGDGGRAGRGRTLPRRDRVLGQRGRRVGLPRGRAPRRPLRPDRRFRPARSPSRSTRCSRRSSSSPRASRRRRARGGGRSRSSRIAECELEPLVSEVVPLDAWERVFADLREGRRVKYVFDPRL